MLPSISSSDIDSRLGLTELSSDLVAHLLGRELTEIKSAVAS